MIKTQMTPKRIFLLLLISTLLPTIDLAGAEDYSLNPIRIHSINPQQPMPTGVASFGVDKNNQNWILDEISTKGIEGRALINSLDAYNPDPGNPSLDQQSYLNNGGIQGANLQLNAMLFVDTTAGKQIFWLQNTNRFDIHDQYVNSPRDLILNETGGRTCNPIYELGGRGGANPPCPDTPQRFYKFGDLFHSYTLPVKISNAIYVRPLIGKGVAVFFYNEPFGRGIFDKVFLYIPNVVDANIVASPKSDVEYVWTGFTSGEKSTFKNMDSYLNLSYVGDDKKFHLYPSLFTFGIETAEKVTNLKVTLSDHGPHISVGNQNNTFLGEIYSQTSSPTTHLDQTNTQTDNTIPSWIKNNANWWSQGSLSDADFVKGIQYLVQQGIIHVTPSGQNQGSSATHQIPSWVKNYAGWWANGQISDKEFLQGIQYLVTSGIIHVL